MELVAAPLPGSLGLSTKSDIVVDSATMVAPSVVQAAVPDIEALVQAQVQARLAVVLEGIGDAFYALDPEWRFSYINRSAEAYFGRPRETMLRHSIWELFPNAQGTELRQRYEEVFRTGMPASFESEAEGVRGRYLEFHVFPYDGGVAVSFRDWTERRQAEEQLRESEARLSSLADNVPACMVYQIFEGKDFYDRKLLYLSKTCERLTGIPAEDVCANPALLYNLVLPEYRDEMHAREISAYMSRTTFDMELEMWHAKTGEVRWHRLIVTPRTQSNGTRVWDALQIDITNHKRAEQHLRLLINELNHRVKNTLATVQSLAAQSLRRIETQNPGEAVGSYRAFEARLFALARGHDILTRENWEGASLHQIVNQAFAPYISAPGENERLEVQGSDLRVSPPIALSLSMALHELCTNAVKYGAMGTKGGRVRIHWETATREDAARLRLTWQESGGPPVEPPSREGFGSRLIQRGLARELNGTVRLSYERSGVVCTIDVPLC